MKLHDIIKYYELFYKCHLQTVNYFASMFGYSFPDHDSDKIQEPFKTIYACEMYNQCFPNHPIPNIYSTQFKDIKNLHHKTALHHVQHYSCVSEIPDINLYEMISDWAAANFALRNIKQDKTILPLEKWFNNNMSQLPWTKHQIEIIKKSFQIIKTKTDRDKLMMIWQDLKLLFI